MRSMLRVVILLLSCALPLFAQYPHVTIRQIQQVPADSLLIADTLTNFSANSNQARWTLQTSPYNGDTVVVTGICVVPAKVITYTAAGWTMTVYDTAANTTQWGGILVRGNSPADTTQLIADGFLNVSPGDIITMTGLVSEFPLSRGGSLTQFQPIAGHPIEIIGNAAVPKPIVKNVADFYQGIFPNGKVRYSTGEPMEGMYVEFHNLTVDNKINTARGTFSATDANGNEISEYDYSHFFTLGHGTYLADTTWQRIYDGLGNGVKIDTLRGVIATSSGSESPRGYRIAPLYPSDIVLGIVPPLLSAHRRNPVVVPPDSTPRISVKATVQLGGNPIQGVSVFYSLNGAPFVSVAMTYQAFDTTYNAQIPQQSVNTVVRYFIKATDVLSHTAILANSAVSGLAADTSKGFFFYTVLNRPLTIRDIQTTPYINGRTPYLGAVVTLSGIITADTSRISLSPLSNGGTSSWYMQSTTQQWSGLWLSTADTTTQRQMSALKNGDSVSVTGTVQEQFDVTRLGAITSVTKVSSGNAEPAALLRTTGSFNVGNGDPGAEPYEGMLVKFNNLTVSDIAPTFSDPTEFSVNDGSGAVIVRRDGRNKYSNLATDTAFGKTLLRAGDKISTLTGIIYYSFNQYKIVPRTDADFGIVTDVPDGGVKVVPSSYALSQNYPNPFNPSTMIAYDIPVAGHITLRVYNLLGQEVATLVNQVTAPGHYTVRFNAGSLASGMYFYRIQTNGFVAVKKMLVVK